MRLGPKPFRLLSTPELRQLKAGRREFSAIPRRPITVVLDGVSQNYNIGAIFRLCDAFLIERLIIAGTRVDVRKRKLVQAARGTQHWVPWEEAASAKTAVAMAKETGAWIAVVEQTSASMPVEEMTPSFPACIVMGSEKRGISPAVIEMADAAVAIPTLGMANSINVASAAAIVLHRLSVVLSRIPP
jgi:tRNA G18 (ribose-2'-O)-methylase SpoU